MASNEYAEHGENLKQKTTLGRKFQLQFARTKGKILHNKSENSELSEIKKLLPKIKTQRSTLNKLADYWKRYAAKSNEINAHMTSFDKILLRAIISDEDLLASAEKIVDESDRTFSKNVEAMIATNLHSFKEPLDYVIKKSKTAEKYEQDYNTSKSILNKCNDLKKQQEQLAVDSAQAKLARVIKDLGRQIPITINETNEGLYQFLNEYLDLKIKNLRNTLTETESIKEHFLRARSKDPGSSPKTQASLDAVRNNNAGSAYYSMNDSASPNNEYCEVTHDTPTNKISTNGIKTQSPNVAKPTIASKATVNSRPDSTPKQASATHRLSSSDDSESDSKSSSSSGSDSSHSDRRQHAQSSDEEDGNKYSKAEDMQTHHEDDDITHVTPPFEVISIFPYTSEEPDELEFNANVVINVLPWEHKDDENASELGLKKQTKEPGWLYGKNMVTNKTGLFPANYVKMLRKL